MGGPETVRAVALFSLLLFLLLGITVQLAFRELSLAVLKEGLDLGRAEAHRIAAEVQVLGATDRGIDFSRVRRNSRALRHFIDARIASRLFITYVEVRDRFGVRQFFVVREDRQPPLAESYGAARPGTICLKCLEKEPARRYPTAQAVAEELARFLRSEPIAARPARILGRLARWCRRKPALADALVGLALLWLALDQRGARVHEAA